MSNYKKFVKHLEDSQESVHHVNNWLKSLGYNAKVNDYTVTDKHENWKDHADNGDITLEVKVEVKRMSFNFTNINDYKYKNTIVCAKHSFDRANPKPLMYVILSKDMEHAAIIKSDTHQDWYVEEKQDKRYDNYFQSFYFTNVKNLKFVKLGKK